MEPLVDAIFVSSINGGSSSVQVYDSATGSNLKTYNGLPASSSSLNFIGKCEYLISGKKDKPLLQAWILNRSEPLQLRLVVPGKVSIMAVNSTGPLYCAIAISENIFIYKLSSGRVLGILKQHYQPVTCLKFSACGSYLVSGGEDGLVMRWTMSHVLDALHCNDVPDPQYKLAQHSDEVTDVFISSGLQGNVISTSLDCTTNIYDLLTGQLRHSIIAPEAITRVTCNVLGSQCFISSISGYVWNKKLLPHLKTATSTVDEESKCKCHDGKITSLVITASGNNLITGGEDGDAKFWKITSSKSVHNNLALLRTLHKGRGFITNIAFLRTEREIFSAADLEPIEVLASISSSNVSDEDSEVTVFVGTSKRDKKMIYPSVIQNKYDKIPLSLSSGDMEELKSSLEMFKSSNSDLYNYAIKHIFGPGQ